MLKHKILAAGLLGLASAVAHAAPVFIANPGFEADVHGPNTFTFGAPSGWLDYNTAAVAGDTIGTLNPFTTTYFLPGQWGGNNVGIAYMQAGGTAGVEFGLRQVLAATLAADTLYTLSVDIGNIASGVSDLGGGPIPFNLDGFPGYRVELRADNVTLVADLNSLASGGNSIPEGEFRTTQLVFDSTAVAPELLGQQLEIWLVNLNQIDPSAVAADREVDFDNLSLDATLVPVPPAVVLLGSCAVLLLRRRADCA